MINGFEKETSPLSQKELDVAHFLAKSFKSNVGIKNARTNGYISDKLKSLGHGNFNGPRLRKIINYIRTHNLVPCLLASSKGYWVAETQQEVLDYLDGLRGRRSALDDDIDSIEKQMNKRFKGRGIVLQIVENTFAVEDMKDAQMKRDVVYGHIQSIIEEKQ